MKCTDIRKFRFRHASNHFRLLSNSFEPLESAELDEPDFWMPIGYDGYRWRLSICIPPWLSRTSASMTLWEECRVRYLREPIYELAGDPEDYLHEELATLRHLLESSSVPDGQPAREKEAFFSAVEMLTEAMLAGYRSDESFPPRDKPSLAENEVLPLSEAIAHIIECAYKAGRAADRGMNYYNGNPEIARKGKRLADQTGRGRQKRSLEELAPWAKRAAEVLRQNRKIDRRALLDILEKERLAEPRPDDKVKLKGKGRAITFGSFASEVSRLCKALDS